MDRPTINEKLYILVYQCEKCGASIVHTNIRGARYYH